MAIKEVGTVKLFAKVRGYKLLAIWRAWNGFKIEGSQLGHLISGDIPKPV